MAGNQTRSNVLITLGVLFTIGGASRILPHAFASAEDKPEVAQHDLAAHTPGPATSLTSASVSTAAIADQVCFTGEAADALVRDQKALDERLQAVQKLELELQTRQYELEQQGADLRQLKATVDERWRQMSAEADQDVNHLAQMYSAMKPDQAAAIFDQMDPAFAAGFLRLMQSDQAGMILAGMETSKAYVVSVRLASLNNDVRAAPINP